jgi:membrane-associated phospholipid phosphatase
MVREHRVLATGVVLFALAGLAVLTEQVLTAGLLTDVDGALRHAVLTHHDRLLDGVLQGLSDIAGSVVEAPLLAALALAVAARRRRWFPVGLVAIALAALGALVLLGKELIGRAGPDRAPDVLHVGGAAFPSGHAAIAVLAPAVAVYLLVRPERRIPWYWGVSLFALVVGAARVYVNEHWATDVVAGWLLGVVLVVPLLTVAGDRWPPRTSVPPDGDFRHPIRTGGHP